MYRISPSIPSSIQSLRTLATLSGYYLPPSPLLPPPTSTPPTLLVLHGLLGSSTNFKTPGSRIRDTLSSETGVSWECLCIDIRGHGSSSTSTHNEDVNTIENAGKDVVDAVMKYTDGRGVDVVVGHSLGGKVAISYLSQTSSKGEVKPPSLTVSLDSIPGRVDRSKASGESESVADVLNAVDGVKIPIQGKKELITELTGGGKVSGGVAMWMTTNLRKREDGDGFEFSFDIPTARDLFKSFGETDYFPFLRTLGEGGGGGPKVLLVRAGKNAGWEESNVKEAMEKLGENENVKVKTLKDAGHWVHVDDLDGVVKAVCDEVKI